MKRQWSFRCPGTLLLSLGLAAAGMVAASEEVIYCARVTSNSTTNWNAPFWWIPAGGSAYGTAAATSTAATQSRAGSYTHTAESLSLGEGFGVVCPACSFDSNTVYRVEVTQPFWASPIVTTNIVFGVCSTNCAIGGLSGGAAESTNTTAFQAAHSVNKWGFVCWLTNTAGVPNPEIEFHYVSGGTNGHKHYVDCVRFTLATPSTVPTPVRIGSFAGSTLEYSGGSGTRFVLLRCARLCEWQRVATNAVTPGAFAIPAVGTEPPAFYAIASE